MNTLLALPHIKRGAMRAGLSAPAWARARAGRELQRAVAAGRVTPHELTVALDRGDAGLAALMSERHVVRGDITCVQSGLEAQWSPEPAVVRGLVRWARALREAGRLDDAALRRIGQSESFGGLVEACCRASIDDDAPALAALPSLPYESRPTPILAVTTSYSEALIGGGSYCFEGDAESRPWIAVEVAYDPVAALPAFTDNDDRLAVYAAMQRIYAVEPFGLWIPPHHAVYVLDAWTTELIMDLGTQCAKDADGMPAVTLDDLQALEAEIGVDLSEPDRAIQSAKAHLAYLDDLNRAPRWSEDDVAFARWRARRKGTPAGALVERLLAVAEQIERLSISRSMFDSELHADAVGVILIERAPDDADWCFQHIDEYGSQEAPVMHLRPADEAQNPGAFWELHEAVVMVASLLTDAHDAIASYQEAPAQSCLAA